MSKKIVITKIALKGMKPATAIVLYENDKADRIELLYDHEEYTVGNVYVAHVNDVVKNINASFVEYIPGKKAYVPQNVNEPVFFVNRKNTKKVCEGDNIIVQLKKEPIKTKDAVCSPVIELSGKYVVLTFGKPGYNVSAKICDVSRREQLEKLALECMEKESHELGEKYQMLPEEKIQFILENTGVIMRTQCQNTKDSLIADEFKNIYHNLLSIFNVGARTQGRTCIYKAENPVSSIVGQMYRGEDITVVSDCGDYVNLLVQNGIPACIYDDKLLPLYKLYSVESVLSQINQSRVWLKSGAYLVIEYTEAMTVIDVNTGKCEKGKDKENVFLNINLEAATEVMHQLRLRNISGIIVVDFIDMLSEDSRQKLMQHLKNEAKKDVIKTSVIDMTRLNLVEITRKKIRERVKIIV